MKNEISGFTLIEVLVVVLIIGILTSVALPQYQKAVIKAEYVRAKTMAASLASGMEAYYATYMTYTPVMEKLDVSFNFTGKSAECTDESASCYYYDKEVWCTLAKKGFLYCRPLKYQTLRYYMHLSYHKSRAGKISCSAMLDSSTLAPSDHWAYKICQQETGKTAPDSSGYFDYN